MKKLYFLISILLINASLFAQDTTVYKARVDFSFPYKQVRMQSSLLNSASLYDLSNWGIDELGDRLFLYKKTTTKRKIANKAFKYSFSYLFAKFGSELPIPLGVWGHEEFHRAVLETKNIESKNGNWMFHRWDGTVYGITDSSLSNLKRKDVNTLLYAYTAGVQYEIALNRKITLDDFYKNRSLSKNALLLYNSLYVYNYFNFSTSSISDSVKVIAPEHESKNASERDFAGADLTAWAYDMFSPTESYYTRDTFPNGEGVNRRIGFSDLSADAQKYLIKQKKLSLLNLLNPAIFFVNKIRFNSELSFNAFTQYTPTYFGNAISLNVPVKYKQYDLFVNFNQFNNKTDAGYGLELGLFNYKWSEKINYDFELQIWNQPTSFYSNTKITGLAVSSTLKYNINKYLQSFVSINAKSKGWQMNNASLANNIAVQFGIAGIW